MHLWRIHVKLRCFRKCCFYICIAFIQSMFSSSLPLVCLFLSLNVCLGLLVFLEPFLTADCCFPAKKRAVLREILPCVIEVTLSVDFQVGIFFMSCYYHACKDSRAKTAFFFPVNSFHILLIYRRFTLMKWKKRMT